MKAELGSAARGRLAEDRALDYLLKQGLQLVTRNYACRMGEIDLIMRHNQLLVFVEVRWRSRSKFGGAAASVGPVKQQRLWRAAEHYLLSYARLPVCRFDLIAIDGDSLEWLRDVISR